MQVSNYECCKNSNSENDLIIYANNVITSFQLCSVDFVEKAKWTQLIQSIVGLYVYIQYCIVCRAVTITFAPNQLQHFIINN